MTMAVTGGFERFRHNWQGYRVVLRSGEVRDELQGRANNVMRAARGRLPTGNEGSGIRLIADTQVGRNRAGATVIGVPMRLEKRYRILGRSIDAAQRSR